MHEIINAILSILGVVVIYQVGKESGYSQALRELAEGKIKLNLYAKSENITKKIVTVNEEMEEN